MKKFIPREKLSPKARKKLDSERRVLWTVPPATKKIESKMHYDRKKRSHERYGGDMGSLPFSGSSCILCSGIRRTIPS